ncbi:MAG: MBL fold metallo-hydrolase [Anaerolineales bacterium]|jgi:L-ascorbate metabolism protein UlaG (beta-lactamase superfamily)
MTTTGSFETDLFPTSAGDLSITFLGHASLLIVFNEKNIFVDPFGQVADYTGLPKADIIICTHEHRDHLDPQALALIRTPGTKLVLNPAGAAEVTGSIAMRNGDKRTVEGLQIEAVPAYNILHKREDGNHFHPKGIGNGYILTFGKTRLYLAGDTENIPEMKSLQDIDIAFLPMNLPYTMTPEMVADAARMFKPHILYPYHYGNTDTNKLVELLKEDKDIEIRIRKMP